jgi:hypothetical protein
MKQKPDTLYIVQVAHVYLKSGADALLSKRSYDAVVDWLSTWSCRGNFRATLASSQQEGIERVQVMLQQKLVPEFMGPGVTPEHFVFEVSMQEVEDGWFWMPSNLVYGTRHPVVGEIRWGK